MKQQRKSKKPLTLGQLKTRIEKLLLEQLLAERGQRCQICGRNKQLGLFHVLPKGSHPRLRFCKDNLLIAGWFCCHLPWHHDYYDARDRIVPRIKVLLGDDYEDRLRALEIQMPRLDRLMLEAMLLGREA